MNKHILEKAQLVLGIVPVDLKTNPGATSDYVSLKLYNRCAIVFQKAIGTAGDDPVITLLQATDVAGTGAKALPFNRIDKKQGTQTGIGQFTTSTAAAPATNDTFTANTWTNSALGEAQGLIVIDVAADDLDIDNGFDCMIANIGDVGTNVQLGALLYILHDPKYPQATLNSAIVD